jgi:Holliday junction resolvasome RuvABC endonuclease subunit
MIIAGVDCSSKNIAITLMEDKLILDNHYIESTLKDMDMRLGDLVAQFENLGIFEFGVRPIDLLIIENPVYLSNPKASSGIAQVIGYVKSVAARYNVRFMGVDNRSWKKSVLANGNADKELIMKFAASTWGQQLIKNQDLADSACIALWGVLRSL